MMANQKELSILLAEDDPGHARLIEKNLRRANLKNKIIKFYDGQQVVDYLSGNGEFNDIIHPFSILILLDLNLPVLDGYEVLKWLKDNPRTKRIPVIILTTTDDTHEISKCYDLGCNMYITKPVEYEQFSEVIRKLGLFLSIITVPNER